MSESTFERDFRDLENPLCPFRINTFHISGICKSQDTISVPTQKLVDALFFSLTV